MDYRTIFSIGTATTWGHLGPPVLQRHVYRVRHPSAKYGPAVARRVLGMRAKGWTYKRIAAALRMPVSGHLTVLQIVIGTYWTVRAIAARGSRPRTGPGSKQSR